MFLFVSQRNTSSLHNPATHIGHNNVDLSFRLLDRLGNGANVFLARRIDLDDTDACKLLDHGLQLGGAFGIPGSNVDDGVRARRKNASRREADTAVATVTAARRQHGNRGTATG